MPRRNHRPKPTPKPFWPIVLRTDPPTLMTREEAYAKVPCMKVTHIPATNPREEPSTGGSMPVGDRMLL